MTSDNHAWFFPPTWAFQNLTTLGPIYLQDTILLMWAPATPSPWVEVWCISASNFGTDMMDWYNIAPPISYQFTKYAYYNGSEDVFCHAIFKDSDNGNTINWQLINSVAKSPTTWTTAVVTWVPSTTGSGASSAPTSASTTTTSASPAPTALCQSGLSPGVSAGIGLGAGIGVLLLALSGIYTFQLLQRRRATSADRQVQPASSMVGPAELGTGTGIKRHEMPSDIHPG